MMFGKIKLEIDIEMAGSHPSLINKTPNSSQIRPSSGPALSETSSAPPGLLLRLLPHPQQLLSELGHQGALSSECHVRIHNICFRTVSCGCRHSYFQAFLCSTNSKTKHPYIRRLELRLGTRPPG